MLLSWLSACAEGYRRNTGTNISNASSPRRSLQLWGGHECTLNRVGNAFFDQTVCSGHAERIEDLALFAGLGLRKLRYPLLWERVAPDRPDDCDWSWGDDRLARIRALGMQPIVGLVHHGSGPSYANLLSEDFAPGLAGHAARAAERYPWIEDWTPVNEPLTTARFAALYGHWHPHSRDEQLFWHALLNEVDATRLAMRAIRVVNPAARLIQTEDVGRTDATPPLAGQAEFDNLRRWGTWDLLCGRVTLGHPLWERLDRFGLGDRLRRIADDPCTPDIVGVNHYLTSDRFLDHRVESYPAHSRGSSGYGPLADVEAVRVIAPAHRGLASALRETWERYRLPMAITEVHNGCTREEQMRWMLEAWNTAEALRSDGVDIRAVTAWSLLGAFGWDNLLTRPGGAYECGVYDVRGVSPRATAMVPLLRSLAGGRVPDHPVLQRPGWWHREDRLRYPPHSLPAPLVARRGQRFRTVRPLLVTGATGTLGQAFAAACAARDIPCMMADRALLALDDSRSIERVLDAEKPWTVINTAGWVRVDDAEHDPEGCLRANRDGSVALAAACADRGIPYVTFSSDLVFDGLAERAYGEGDAAAPLGVYGRSKAEADAVLLSWTASILVIRTAAFFSPHDPHNFAMHLLKNLREGRPLRAADDCFVSPTFVPDLVRVTLDLAIDGATGLWHLVNQGGATWAEFGREIARSTGLEASLVTPVSAEAMGWVARRPREARMRSTRGELMPSLDDAIHRFAASVR